MSAFRLLSTFIILDLVAPLSSHGSVLSQTISCAALMMEVPVKALMASVPEHVETEYRSLTGTKIFLRTGRRLGQGWVGSVVEVTSISGQASDLSSFSGPLVAKLPNRLHGLFSPLAKAKKEIRNEWAMYQKITAAISEIQTSPRYPRFAGWSWNRVPVVPILGLEETTEGPILLKPKIPPGSFLKDIAQIYHANGSKLPAEMEESLFHIYEFLQISGRALRVWPDARPANLVWISDPEMMSLLGFQKPNFAVVEFSSGPLPTYSEPLNSFWGFRSEFINLLWFELIKNRAIR